MILQPMPIMKQKVKLGYSSLEASGRLLHTMWVYNPSVYSSEWQGRTLRQHGKAVRPRSVGHCLAAPGKVFAWTGNKKLWKKGSHAAQSRRSGTEIHHSQDLRVENWARGEGTEPVVQRLQPTFVLVAEVTTQQGEDEKEWYLSQVPLKRMRRRDLQWSRSCNGALFEEGKSEIKEKRKRKVKETRNLKKATN